MRLASWCCCCPTAVVDTVSPLLEISPASPSGASRPRSSCVKKMITPTDGRQHSSMESARSRNKSSVVAISALPSSIQALYQACNDRGGFDYLSSMSSTRNTVSVNDFCNFCIDNLGIDSSIPLSVLSLLDTSNNVVKLPKLVSVLKVIQPVTLLPPANLEAPAAPQLHDIINYQAIQNISLLEELANVLDVEAIDLHADFARGGSEAVMQQLMVLLKQVTKSRCVRSIPDIKLPHGTNAPYVAARTGSSNLGFQVPIWSLRAVHQAKPDAAARPGRRGRPQYNPHVRVLQQGDTIATALLRQHLLASGIISPGGGLQNIPKAVRGQTLGLRPVGTDGAGRLSLAGERVAGFSSARTSMVGYVPARENPSELFSKCLTKLEHSLSTQAELEAECEIEEESVGARLARASRQGLPGGITVADIVSPTAPAVLSTPATGPALVGTRHITHEDGASHEESFREGMAGLQCEAPQRPVLASAPPAHITWADQECTRDSLSDSCVQQDSVQLSPASCPGTLPTLVGTASAPPSGALGCGEAVPGPPAPARHIDVSSSTLSATAQRPVPQAGDRDSSAVAAFGLMHAKSSKHRVVEAGEAADRFGSAAVAEGRLPGGCVRAVAHRP